MGWIVLLYGPKCVGKSRVAEAIQSRLGVHHVDPDALILDLLRAGVPPDPEHGWLAPVEAALRGALEQHEAVSVEATGAWDSDYVIADHLEASGHRVLRVRFTAPEDVTLQRLRSRRSRKVPVSEAEARAIYASASARAADARWDLIIDTSGSLDEEAVADAVRRLASLSR